MNTKGIKFLAVLAVLAFAFAAFAVVTSYDESDAVDTENVGTLAQLEAALSAGKTDITVTDSFNITSGKNITLPSGTELKIAGANLLTIDSGATLAIAKGATLKVTGTGKEVTEKGFVSLRIDGTLKNDGVINDAGATNGLLIRSFGTITKLTDGTGVIVGNNTASMATIGVFEGKLEYQTVYPALNSQRASIEYASSAHITGPSATGTDPLTISNNVFMLTSDDSGNYARGLWIRLAGTVATNPITISDNQFIAENELIRYAIKIDLAGVTGTSVTIKDNSFNGIVGHKDVDDAMVQFGGASGSAASNLATIGTTSTTGVNFKIDDVPSLTWRSSGSLTFKGDMAFDYLYVDTGCTIVVDENVTLTNNGSILNNGTITDNGTIVSNGAFINNGTVTNSAGIINAYDATCIPLPVTASTAANVKVDGTVVKVTTVEDTGATAIQTALGTNDVVIYNTADSEATAISIPAGKVLTLKSSASFKEGAVPTITIAEGAELVLDGITTKSYKLTNGETGATAGSATLDAVSGTLAIGYGSIVISGTVTAGTITTAGEIEAAGLTVDTGASVTISSTTGANISLEDLYIKSGTLNLIGMDIKENSSVYVKKDAVLVIGTETTKVNVASLTITGPGATTTKIYGDANSSYYFPEGETINGTYYIGAVKYIFEAAVAGNGGMTLSSDGLSGNVVTATKIEMDKGVVSGLTVSGAGTTFFSGTYTVSGRITVATGATLDLGNAATTATIKSNAVITVSGTLTATYDSKIALENNGTITIKSGGVFNDGKMTITGDGVIEYEEAENVYISGTISDDKLYGSKQIVTVVGNLNIKAGCTVTVNGQFIVNEGVTVTIEEGASIIITGAAARLTNDGAIILDAASTLGTGAILTGASNAVLTNNGTISLSAVEGKATTFTTGGKLTNNGLIIVGEDATMTGDLTNAVEAIVTIHGSYTGIIYNYSVVNVDGTVSGTINMMSKDSGVLITKLAYTAAGLTITANKKIDTNIKSDLGSVKFAPADGYAIAGVTVTVGVEKVSSTGTETRAYITLDGESSVTTTNGTSMPTDSELCATITVVSNKVIVDDALSLDKYTKLVVDGKLYVTGSLSAAFTKDKAITGTGTFNVTGAASVIKNASDVTTIEAAYFFKTASSVTTHYYTTLAYAIEIGATPITVSGKQTISANVTIPSGTKVTFNGETTVSAGKVLTVSDGAALVNNSTITVNGKMIVENKKNVTGTGSIVSDVKSTLGASETYTSLATALSEAEIGSVVVLRKNVTLTEDLTIPDFKGVDVDNYTITVTGATLTVDGMLYLRDKGIIVQDDTKGNEGKLVVTGIVVSDKAFTNMGEVANAPAGAYYKVVYESALYYCMSPIAVALENVAIIEDNIALYGEKLALGTIEVNHNIDVYGNIVSGIITIDDGYTITAKNIIGISATIGNTEGNAILVKTTVASGTAFASSAKSVFSMKGTIETTDYDYPIVLTGDVSVSGKIDHVSVIGDVTITDNTTITYLNISGSVTVNNSKTLTIGLLQLNGTLLAKEKSDDGSAAKIVINSFSFIGITPDLGAATVLSGDVKIDEDIALFIAADAIVPASFEDLECTALYVSDEEWIYVVSSGSAVNIDVKTIMKVFEIPVVDAIVNGFEDEYGEDVTEFDVGEYDALYASIKYDIYTVKIITDAGVKSVAINGIELENRLSGNVFEASDLKAGTYKVTYTLKSGYQGTAILSTSTGTVLKDNSFVLSGTEAADRDVAFQLAGTEPIPEPEPTPTPEEKSEWTVTTILLCVLVVLIAIMAVIVALRLNRN